MSISSLKLSVLSLRIKEIQKQIEHINNATNEAIRKLETQKKELREGLSEYPIIQRNIQQLTVAHDRIVEKLLQHQTDVKDKKASLEALDFTISELDREISRIQAERDRTVVSLVQKKEEVRKALAAADEAADSIKMMDDQIMFLTQDHESQMQNMQAEKDLLKSRSDLTEAEKELAMAKLERQIQEMEETHQQNIQSLERQKAEPMNLLREYDEGVAAETKNNILSEIEDLEQRKIGSTPSEIEAINARIANLRKDMEDLELLGELKARGLKITPSGRIETEDGEVYSLEEAINKGLLDGLDITTLLLKNKFQEQGIKVSKSGRITSPSGKLMTLEEAKARGLIDDTTISQIGHTLGKKSSVSLSSMESYMSSEDVHYLKLAVGKPLTLALAEICAKQPRDPIHYLGHWLFKYRYNQEIDVCKKQEIEALMAERERLRLEAWHKEAEDTARATLIDLLFRTQDKVTAHEIQAARALALLSEEEEGEEETDALAEEAKDILGEYNGPPAGQRRI